MTDYRITEKGVSELRTIVMLHQNFTSALNPESVYVLYGRRQDDGTVDVTHSVMVHNSHPSPVDGFQVRRSDLEEASVHLLAAEPDLEVVGVAHTHEGPEDPAPSREDIRNVAAGHLHAVVSPQHSAIVFYGAAGETLLYHLVGQTFKDGQGQPLGRTITTSDSPSHERNSG